MSFLNWISALYWHIMGLFGYHPVFYYGCPNSKRAEKLQLKKQLFR